MRAAHPSFSIHTFQASPSRSQSSALLTRGAHEGHGHHAPDEKTLTASYMLIGGVTLVMAMFYLVQHPVPCFGGEGGGRRGERRLAIENLWLFLSLAEKSCDFCWRSDGYGNHIKHQVRL